MNYLAHFYLSGDSEDLIIGNFIADTVKGSQLNNYSEEIKKGIALHRSIDSYTDTHPTVRKSKERLRKNYRKYANVIVDIFYDHFLARNWANYSNTPLLQYSESIYKTLDSKQHLFPHKSKLFYSYMTKNNILNAYAEIGGIDKVLYGMSRRATFISNMEKATNDLELYYELFEEEFRIFFPDLKNHVSSISI